MSQIYVVIKGAKEATGERFMATTEKCFRDPNLAQQWLKNQKIVWEETIGDALFYCERAVHPAELVE
jgi:hypothetical protein